MENGNYIEMGTVGQDGTGNPEDKSVHRLEGAGEEDETVMSGPRVRVEDIGAGKDTVQVLLERERQKLGHRRSRTDPT